MNEQQFKERIIPLTNRLYGLCVRVLGNQNEAKDCLQDVFIKLWTSRQSLTEVKSIEAFATTITRNQCLDRLRIRKNNVDINFALNHFEDQQDSAHYEEDDMRLKLVNKALTQLNEFQQQVFTMRDIERMEFDEIAQLLGTTQENTRMALSRARKRIREIVELEFKGKSISV